MGGYGSGTRLFKKPSTDRAFALDVRQLARRGGLAPGDHTYTWPGLLGDAVVAYSVEGDTLTLAYQISSPFDGDRHVRQPVALVRTPCHYGGERPWFACPGCGGRVAVLHLLGLHFRCRRCHGLVYASTREDQGRRQFRKANRLRAQLGAPPVLGLIPRRPAWLSWRRYWRTVDRIRELDAQYLDGMDAHVATLRQAAGLDT
ncbi:MAG: hypothetical protein ACRDJW_04640 [Thermomicrobiales bacterium]